LDLVNRFCTNLEGKISEILKAAKSNARETVPTTSPPSSEDLNRQTPIESLENSFQAAKISSHLSKQLENPSVPPHTHHSDQVNSVPPKQPPGTTDPISMNPIPDHSPPSSSSAPACTKPKKKTQRKRKSSILDNTAPKDKRTRRPLTYAEKEERARRAAKRKDQRLASVHAEVPCPAGESHIKL
jgi:hypothetical protein